MPRAFCMSKPDAGAFGQRPECATRNSRIGAGGPCTESLLDHRRSVERPATGDSKQAKLIAMLERPDGATIDEIAKKLEWQAHTVRGAMAGALEKRLKLKIESKKVEAKRRVYRIVK